MAALAADFNPHSVEIEVLSFWRSRRLPPEGGVLGPPTGPVVRQFEGAWTQGDFPAQVAHRAVAADVDARYLALIGRRTVGTLRQGTGPGPATATEVPAALTSLGIWTGGDGRAGWDSEDRAAGVQAIVGRLASKGILVTRDESFRVCPSCGSPRSPERIIYEEQEGDTFLVRFPVSVKDRTVHALVWVDVPWKLLGTSALLVNPGLTYVVAGYQRREDRGLVLTSASSLERLRSWIPDALWEVKEELAGRALERLPYTYPLRHEFPMGGDLTPPAGTILGTNDVTDTGTGIVPLVPGHGPTDARIAARFGVAGWPLVTPKGMLDVTLMHKYAGLDLDTASEFVLRDLSEAGALLARLRVKRGVPHCAICGTALLWTPGRAWCLESSRLPPERHAVFSRLLPEEALPGPTEVAPWPVTEAVPSDDPQAVALLECPRCDRLEPPGAAAQCPCGGQRRVVRRRLLPSSGGAFAAWARFDPFPDGDSVHLYVPLRRRVPATVNHIAALTGVQGIVGDVSLTLIPTVTTANLSELAAKYGADVVRAALVRSGTTDSAGRRFTDRCRQEDDRVRRWWAISQGVVAMCDASMMASFARSIGGFLGEIEIEDRAIVARWERTRTLALSHYDHFAMALVHRCAFRFLDNDLVAYYELVRPRLALAGSPTTKRAALRTLAHLLRGLSEVLAPILPFISEAVHRAFSAERTSIFEHSMGGLDRGLLNDDLVASWDRWIGVIRCTDRMRRSLGVDRSTMLPSVVLVLPADDLADKFRADAETIARLARIQRLEVASPRQPWAGRHRAIRPVESEIQRAYPAQASQVVHLLRRMPPRRWESPLGQEELTVVINGLPKRVFPNMVVFSDTLPDRVIPFPWALGEMYIEQPAGVSLSRTPMPPLSADGYWLVHRLEQRLRPFPSPDRPPVRVALVTAKSPLSTELRSASVSIAAYLGLREFRVVESSEEPTPTNAMTGRTRTGDRWWVHVPDLPARRVREKRLREGARGKRVSVSPVEPPAEFDFSDPTFVAHEEAIRALGQELDGILGIPLLGPSKIASAWDLGIRSVDDLRRSSFATVAELPGFGGPVAEAVMAKLGGVVPSTAHRTVRIVATVRVPTGSASAPGPARASSRIAAPTPRSVPEPPAARGSARPEEKPILEETRPSYATDAGARPVPGSPLSSSAPEPTPGPASESTPAAASGPAEPGKPAEFVGAFEEPELEHATQVLTPTPAHETPEPATFPEVAEPTTEPIPEPEVEEPSPTPEATVPTVAPGSLVVEPMLSVPEPPRAPEGADSSHEPPPFESAGIRPESPIHEELATSVDASATVPTPPTDTNSERTEAEFSDETSSTVEPARLEEASPLAENSTSPSAHPSLETTIPPAETRVPPSAVQDEEGPGAEDPQLQTRSPLEPGPAETHGEAELPASAAEPSEVDDPLPVRADVTLPDSEPAGVGADLASEASESPPPPLVTDGPMSEVATDSTSEESVQGAVPEDAAVDRSPPELTSPPDSVPSSASAPEVEVEPASPTSEVISKPEPSRSPTSPNEVVENELTPTVAPALLAAPISEEPEPPSPHVGVELTFGDSLVASLSAFLEAASAGHHGVCLVRESPERIRARVGSRPVEVYWLTNIGRGPALRPSDLEGMWNFLARKIAEERVTVFFLEGIEYLVRLHGPDAVLNGLVGFDRLARDGDARIWVYFTPSLMKPDDLERFRATFGAGSTAV